MSYPISETKVVLLPDVYGGWKWWDGENYWLYALSDNSNYNMFRWDRIARAWRYVGPTRNVMDACNM